jgi:hypothetical protein
VRTSLIVMVNTDDKSEVTGATRFNASEGIF